jgi:hypothetical protein
MNFPFICSNIPAAPACGVYIYISVDIFDRWLLLTRKLLNQGYTGQKDKQSIIYKTLENYRLSYPHENWD